jgi:uncharacterized membrane protein (UPF0127 family)
MAKKFVRIINLNNNEILIEKGRWCNSAWSRLVGFQFRRKLRPGEALILVYPRDSIRSTSIHMFFVGMSLGVFWINCQGLVTSAQHAKPWRPYYASPAPARYVLETSPEMLEKIRPGEILNFVERI